MNRRLSLCENRAVHLKQAKCFWKLYCKLGLERQTLYESGAVHAQLFHLLKTLPNLRQIVITDRRRRQSLSWLQEALLSEAFQGLPRSEPRIPQLSRFRRALGNLQGVRKRTTGYSSCGMEDSWTWFRSSLKNENEQALAQMQVIQSVGCDCFDEEPPSFGRLSGLGQSESKYMPQTPWAEIMKALHTSPDVSVDTVSIQPKDRTCYLPFAAIEVCDPCIFLSTTTVLARLTKLELRLDNLMMINGQALRRMYHELEGPTKMLSAAAKLQSLTITPSATLSSTRHSRTGG